MRINQRSFCVIFNTIQPQKNAASTSSGLLLTTNSTQRNSQKKPSTFKICVNFIRNCFIISSPAGCFEIVQSRIKTYIYTNTQPNCPSCTMNRWTTTKTTKKVINEFRSTAAQRAIKTKPITGAIIECAGKEGVANVKYIRVDLDGRLHRFTSRRASRTPTEPDFGVFCRIIRSRSFAKSNIIGVPAHF